MSSYSSRVPGPYRVVVQSVRVVDSRPVLTVLEPRTGQVWSTVTPLTSGGGLDCFSHEPIKSPDPKWSSGFVTSPEEAHATEGFLHFDWLGAPFFVGAGPREQPDLREKSPEDLANNEPHPGWYGLDDKVQGNGYDGVRTKQILARDRSYNLIAGGQVRFQIPEGFEMRIFRGSDAKMPVVKFVPMRDAHNDLVDRYNALSAKFEMLAAHVVGIGVTGGGGSPAVIVNPALSTGFSYSHDEAPRAGTELASKTLYIPEEDE